MGHLKEAEPIVYLYIAEHMSLKAILSEGFFKGLLPFR